MTDAKSIFSVALVAFGCAAILGVTAQLTATRIERNETRHLHTQLNELLAGRLTPESMATAVWQSNVLPLCDGSTIVRTSVDGYAGPIELLVAITTGEAPAVQGLRVVSQRETPGIADFLNQPHTGWLKAIENHNLTTVPDIDSVSGATISSNAVLRAVTATLSREPVSRVCG